MHMPTSSNNSSNYNNYKLNKKNDDETILLRSASSSSTTPHHQEEEEEEGQLGSSCSVVMLIMKKVGLGFVGAAHVCMVLVIVAAVAVSVGVGLVRFWLEEPIFLKEKLHFDYTQIHPNALYSFSPTSRVPSGHMFQVSVALLMPESQYNRQLGIFQLRAEIVGENGEVIGRWSEACMLRFRSLPIRMMRVLVLGLPILLGMSNEAQKADIVMLRHKEMSTRSRSDSIRVSLIPRAGTVSQLPQVYEAHIFVQSHLPFFKRILHRWKWTLYVWVSMNIFMMMLLIMLCFCKPSLLLLSGPRSLIQLHRSSVAAHEQQQQLWRRRRTRNENDGDNEYNNYNEDDDQYPLASRRRSRRGVVAVGSKSDDDNVEVKELVSSSSSELLLLLKLRLHRSRTKRKAAAAALLFNSHQQPPPNLLAS